MDRSPSGLSPLSFRLATPADVGAIVGLVNSAYRGETSRQGWTTEADFLGGQRTDAQEVGELLAADASAFLLAFQGEALVGSLHLQRDADAAWLGMFAIRPGRQGEGLGKALMRAAEARAAAEWGAKRLRMAVITFRHELIAFYERRGYRRTGELKPFPASRRYGIPRVAGLALAVLEKALASPPSPG